MAAVNDDGIFGREGDADVDDEDDRCLLGENGRGATGAAAAIIRGVHVECASSGRMVIGCRPPVPSTTGRVARLSYGHMDGENHDGGGGSSWTNVSKKKISEASSKEVPTTKVTTRFGSDGRTCTRDEEERDARISTCCKQLALITMMREAW